MRRDDHVPEVRPDQYSQGLRPGCPDTCCSVYCSTHKYFLGYGLYSRHSVHVPPTDTF